MTNRCPTCGQPIPEEGPGFEEEEWAVEAAIWYYDLMIFFDLISAKTSNRAATLKRWQRQWQQVGRILGEKRLHAFGDALKWAIRTGEHFWWTGPQGRCESPGAWLKLIRGEERTRAEALIDKYKASEADRQQKARIKQNQGEARYVVGR